MSDEREFRMTFQFRGWRRRKRSPDRSPAWISATAAHNRALYGLRYSRVDGYRWTRVPLQKVLLWPNMAPRVRRAGGE